MAGWKRGEFMSRVSKLAAGLAALMAFSVPAFAAEILIKDDKSQPESLAAAPDNRRAPCA